MLLWIVLAVLTAGALYPLLAAALRPQGASTGGEAAAIYRRQLAEAEAEAARGTISAGDLKAVRAEIARRLLAAEDAAAAAEGLTARPARRLALSVAIGVPALALGLYLVWGSPGTPDQPLSGRAAAAAEIREYQALVAQLAQAMERNPADPRGWILLGRAYAGLGRHADAAASFARAVEAETAQGTLTAETLSTWGEALVVAAEGVVTEAAAEAFRRARGIDPADPRARFFEGLKKAQEGDTAGAAALWQAMLDGAPADAPWRPMVEAQLAAAGAGQAVAPPDIGAMVARLEQRLAEAPDDLAGWLRLARSHAVLGDRASAAGALARARGHFAGDSAALARIDASAKALDAGELPPLPEE